MVIFLAFRQSAVRNVRVMLWVDESSYPGTITVRVSTIIKIMDPNSYDRLSVWYAYYRILISVKAYVYLSIYISICLYVYTGSKTLPKATASAVVNKARATEKLEESGFIRAKNK